MSVCANAAVSILPGASLHDSVEAYPPGTLFIIKSGVHRLQYCCPKDGMTFEGEQGAVLSGAKPIESWRHENSLWVADSQYYDGNIAFKYCGEGEPECGFTNDVYMNDTVMLERAPDINSVQSGMYYLDYASGRLYLADDPRTLYIEISASPYAIFSAAKNVTINNLTIEKYAVYLQHGAIQCGSDDSTGYGWTISNTEIRRCHGTGLKLFGNSHHVYGCSLHHNGQLGLSVTRSCSTNVENNSIFSNQTAGVQIFWEGGGAKFVKCTSLVVDSNIVSRNDGVGLWTDIDNYDIRFTRNTVEFNTNIGIFHELSDDAVIMCNTVRGNARTNHIGWLYGGQICVSSSNNAVVSYNLVEVFPAIMSQPANGITVFNQPGRDAPSRGRNSYVHHNVIVFYDELGVCGIGDDVNEKEFVETYGNRFDYNAYFLPGLSETNQGKYWHWLGDGWTFEVLRQDAGQELNGSVTHDVSGPFKCPQFCVDSICPIRSMNKNELSEGQIRIISLNKQNVLRVAIPDKMKYKQVNVKMFNMAGRKMFSLSSTPSCNIVNINTTQIPAGRYSLNISSNDGERYCSAIVLTK
jgi:hypothetical protein